MAVGACGGSPETSGPPPPPSDVNVTVSPREVAIDAGESVAFSATVTGGTDGSVLWTVRETGGGVISAAGVYTAPASAGLFHVVATSRAEPAHAAEAAVSVRAAGTSVSIAIDPANATVAASGAVQFAAVVTGSSDTAVSWAVREVGGGTIDIARQIRALKQSGYDGTITLEVFTPDRNYLAYSRDILRKLWNEPKAPPQPPHKPAHVDAECCAH